MSIWSRITGPKDPIDRTAEQYVGLLQASRLNSSRAVLSEDEVAHAVKEAQDAYTVAGATNPRAGYDQAKEALAQNLSAVTSSTVGQIRASFDAAHLTGPAASTPESIAKAATAVATNVAAPFSGDLKLSSPSLLGANVRVFFGILMFLAMIGAGLGLYLDSRHTTTSTASLVCLSVIAAISGIIFLVIINGYGHVEISGARGSAAPPAANHDW
jgi:hypothetical protein